ncbi:MAG: bifunctional folylpolyglutamate synthase/dihydrofolate synthase, partial [Rubrivirga sp.]
MLRLPRFATDTGAFRPGLDRIEALLDALGNPQRAFPAIHVAGTNGKGSTSSMAASVASAAGLRVGLHTSPHLLTLRERMRIGGVAAPASWLDAAVADLEDALETIGPSFFEASLALSLAYFRDHGVDLAV